MRLFRGPKPEIVINVQNEPLYSGGTLKTEVTVTTNRRIRIRDGRIELICREAFYEEKTSGRSSYLQKGTGTPFNHSQSFVSDSEFSSGQVVYYKTTFQIPEDAPPTIEGDTANVSWSLEVKLDIPNAADVSHVQELIIMMPARLSQQYRIPYSQRLISTGAATYEQCTLSLALDEEQVIGGKLNGEFIAQCWQNIEAQEVRLELERSETAWDKTETYRAATQIILQEATLDQSAVYKWPLDISVPDSQTPSIGTKGGSRIEWKLKGVIRKRGLLPFVWRVEKAIQVVSAHSNE